MPIIHHFFRVLPVFSAVQSSFYFMVDATRVSRFSCVGSVVRLETFAPHVVFNSDSHVLSKYLCFVINAWKCLYKKLKTYKYYFFDETIWWSLVMIELQTIASLVIGSDCALLTGKFVGKHSSTLVVSSLPPFLIFRFDMNFGVTCLQGRAGNLEDLIIF